MTKSTDTDPNELRTYAFKLRRNNPESWSHKASADTIDKCALRIEQAEAEVDIYKAEVRFRQSLVEQLQGEIEALSDKYNELIMSVGNKYHNETRHETALRYIRKAETTDAVAALATRPGEKHE